jgi:hypothetical protein
VSDLIDQHQTRLARHLNVAEGKVELGLDELSPRLPNVARKLALVRTPEGAIDQAQDLGSIVGNQDASALGLGLWFVPINGSLRARSELIRLDIDRMSPDR